MKIKFLISSLTSCFIFYNALSSSFNQIPFFTISFGDTTLFPKNKVDKRFGFREIILEQDITEISKKVAIDKGYKDSGLVIYNVTDKKFKIYKGCNLEDIFFLTYNDKVLSIIISTKSTDPNCILKMLKKLYGECSTCLEAPTNRFTWVGQNATVSYQVNSGRTITSISSNKLELEYDKYKSSK